MRRVLADAHFWVALIDRNDRHHMRAKDLRRALRRVPLITSNVTLAEVLAFYAGQGAHTRRLASAIVREILADEGIEVVELTTDVFTAGLDLYEMRPDKDYSLADCVCMQVMRQSGISEALTYDHHFEQEGFVALLR